MPTGSLVAAVVAKRRGQSPRERASTLNAQQSARRYIADKPAGGSARRKLKESNTLNSPPPHEWSRRQTPTKPAEPVRANKTRVREVRPKKTLELEQMGDLDDHTTNQSRSLSPVQIAPQQLTLASEDVTFSGHTGTALCLCVGGTSLYCSSSDGGVTQWDIETKALQGKLQGHEKPVHTVLYNGGRLFTACEDAIRVWQDREAVREVRNQYAITRIAVQGSRGRTKGLLAGLVTGDIVRHEEGEVVGIFQGHVGAVTSLEVCGGTLFSAAHDGVVMQWDLHAALLVSTFWSYGPVSAICAIGGYLYTGSTAGRAKRYLTTTGECDISVEAHEREITACCSFVVDRPYIITAAEDGTISLWEQDLGRPLQSFQAHTGAIRGICVNAGCIFTASEDGAIKAFRCVRDSSNANQLHREGDVVSSSLDLPHFPGSPSKGSPKRQPNDEEDDTDCIIM